MQWAIAGTALATVLSFVALAEAAGAVGLEAGYSTATTAATRVYTAEEYFLPLSKSISTPASCCGGDGG
jgi:hypothetical protein